MAADGSAGDYPGFRVETWRGGQTGRAVVKVTPLQGDDRTPMVGYAGMAPDAAIREIIGAIRDR